MVNVSGLKTSGSCFRMAIIGDRLAQKPAIVHDVDNIAQPNDETGDRDVGPAGIHV